MLTKDIVALDAKLLAGVALAADKPGGARPYLEGVCLEIRKSGITYVATQEYIMLAAYSPAEEGNAPTFEATIILPIEAVLKVKPRDYANGTLLLLERLSDTSYMLSDMRVTPIDGTFPDWRHALPEGPLDTSEPKVHSHFDPKYVALMAKAAKIFETSAPTLHHANEPTRPAAVSFIGVDAFGVIMPLRGGGVWTRPTWVTP